MKTHKMRTLHYTLTWFVRTTQESIPEINSCSCETRRQKEEEISGIRISIIILLCMLSEE